MVESPTTLDLWRFAAQLLRVTRTPPWEGALRKAGFKDFRVNARLYDREGHDLTPDITAVSETGWLVVDITAKADSKREKLDAYRRAVPQYLSRDHGLTVPTPAKEPETLVIRKHLEVDDAAAQLVLNAGSVIARHTELISDGTLRQALRGLDGEPLARLPTVPIAFVPESRPYEVREGLVPIVMELLQKPGSKKSVHDLVSDGLDFLEPGISAEDRKRLIEIVRISMDELVSAREGPLAGELKAEGGFFSSALPEPPHSKSLGRIEESLRGWIDSARKGRVKKLAEFPG